MEDVRSQLARNLESVEKRISQSAIQSGRHRSDIQLVAITKYVSAEVADVLAELGCRNLGESRPQMLWEKTEQMAHKEIVWHLVGPLQRNKVQRTVSAADWIHSVDRLPLLRAIEQSARSQDRTIRVLLEVNVSGDLNKHGVLPESLPDWLEHMAPESEVTVEGLMCMSGLESSDDEKRQQFSRLRELRDGLVSQARGAIHWPHLSMGMSDDFEMAVEEGATMVRLGSVLFEGLTA